MNSLQDKLAAFERILLMMDELREKCPWDRKQTFETLRHLTIEEVYELGDAITENDLSEIKEELGDILLHMVFYAKIGEEKGAFDIASVIHALCDKMERRHPHIYGDVEVKDDVEVAQNWEQLKLKEGKSTLGGVPKSLPAMVKAYRIQEKAKKVGFEWETKEQVWEKVEEEMGELKEAMNEKTQAEVEEEFGDLLFSMINYSRFIEVDPEFALEKTNKKFIARFQEMERIAKEDGKQLADMTLEEMDGIWNEIKHKFH